jgi:hypothetical protein
VSIPTFSVVIPLYDKERRIAWALQSVPCQPIAALISSSWTTAQRMTGRELLYRPPLIRPPLRQPT